jgi:hypothetical protein
MKRIFSADETSNKAIKEEIAYLVNKNFKILKKKFY